MKKCWTYEVGHEATSVYDENGEWIALFPTKHLDEAAGNSITLARARARAFIKCCGAQDAQK